MGASEATRWYGVWGRSRRKLRSAEWLAGQLSTFSLSQHEDHYSPQYGQIAFYHVPNASQADSKVVVNEDITEAGDGLPRDIRVLALQY